MSLDSEKMYDRVVVGNEPHYGQTSFVDASEKNYHATSLVQKLDDADESKSIK